MASERKRKVIAAINMTLDGFCDHTAVIADDELHRYYAKVIAGAGVVLYGRITYQLMEFWPTVMKNPTGNKSIDAFAAIMDAVPKIVFSRTLKTLEWKSARLAEKNLEEEVAELKRQAGKSIYVGSPSLILSLTKLSLIDEYQICVHPVVIGRGLPLFKDISDRIELKLAKTKTLGSGAIVVHYVGAPKRG
jgi:dihydrofolate reductase